MMDILFHGVGWTDIALTLNRIAVGMFFMLSGYHKLFDPERHRVFAEELKELGVHAVGFNQWWVPTVEFSAGGAVVNAGATAGILFALGVGKDIAINFSLASALLIITSATAAGLCGAGVSLARRRPLILGH